MNRVRERPEFPAIRLSLVAGLFLLLWGGLPARASENPDKISGEVRDALTVAPTARVVLFLEIPPVPARETARLRREVALAQGKVLGLLGPKEFVVSHRFLAVPALAGEITSAGLDRLAESPGVVRVDLDAPVRAHLAQSVPLIHADQMQALGYDGAGVTVAILDTGVDTDHPDLSDDLVGQECWCTGGCCPNGTSRQSGTGAAEDGDGHGTNVAGIVTSKGVVSSVGVAPNAKIIAVKVLSNTGSGSISDTISALDWIYANRPQVKAINMSLGAGLFSGNCDTATSWTLALSTAINNLRANGALTVASAGNDASASQMSAPACIANALSVGAVYDANIGSVSFGPPASCTDSSTQADKVTCFSNSNSTTDVFAPGAAIRSDYPGGGTATYYGTSQASPHVAGCAADLLTAVPSLTPAEIEATLEASGVPVTNPRNNLTFPRIDCLAALANLGACIDRDQDGYGHPGSAECPNGDAVDCDDTHSTVYPGAPQICDGLNNDCNDPGWPTVPSNEVDQDGDQSPLCADCNDLDPTVYPGAPQLCDGVNNDCNDASWPAVPADEIDADGDTYLACADCDDTRSTVYPGAPQICDGLNNDCLDFAWPALTGTNELDDDGDSFSECQGDCNDFVSTIYPGAPQICDGYNNDCNAPGWPSTAGTNETDDDGDFFSECQQDCNDANSAVYPGAPQICDGLNNDCLAQGWPSTAGTNDGDNDGDSFSQCQGDCNDTNPAVYPGAPQICDGLNNDCLAPGWPTLVGTTEFDDDSDTFSECQGDCDDVDADTHPRAVETNDGRDNECPGDPGHGIVDEISGPLLFGDPADPSALSWSPQPAASSYELIRSTSPAFPPACVDAITQTPSWSDPAVPAAPNGLFYYLVRSISPHIGSWGVKSGDIERIGICGAESICDDGLDNDGDGLTDCTDPDCFQDPACAPATFTFLDTTGDDIAPAALLDFFSSISASSTDYIFFSVAGPAFTDFAWCSERADFYRDSYLAMAETSGIAYSGNWNRWSIVEGGTWMGPDTNSYENRYALDCVEGHAWCAESGLGGREPVILPEETNQCEAGDLTLGCGDGAVTFILRIGPQRLSTCGF